MSITYEWEITEILTKTEGSNEDSVVQVHWVKRGVDADGYVGEFRGTVPLTSVNSSNFTSFSDLTESQVLTWVQAAAIQIEDRMNSKIQEQIDLSRNPKVSKPMPWIPSEE